MYKISVFIISKRKELSIKYKKLLEGLNADVSIINSLSETFKKIPMQEPEIIILSDTIGENLSDLAKKIRVLTFNFRPTIIAISKSDDTMDKLQTLEAGADDFLSESISGSEFLARIKAHLRQYIESSLNKLTFFVSQNLTIKALKKAICDKKNNVAMLLNVEGLDFYREIYGEIAYEKVLQTLSSIINSALGADDFAGHYLNDKFVIVTSFEKAEKVASFLTFAFDNVVEHFYAQTDVSNKFMLYSTDNVAESKIPLMRLSVAALEIGKNNFKDYKEILNALFPILKLCKKSDKSSYLIDRIKIAGKIKKKQKEKILIFENDDALFYLLKTACELKNYEVLRVACDENISAILKKAQSRVAIIDYGNQSAKEGVALCKKIKSMKNCDTKIIFSSSIHKKEEILRAGADLYLPKPYDIAILTNWIDRYILNIT